jgi:predicted transcriptional regulator
MKKASNFNIRSFTSFTLAISTFIMSWSGFVLYVAPPGRIANWGTWKLMLFTKTEWQALHTIFSYLFFILVVIHLFFVNWKTFLTYFRSKLKSGLNKKGELTSALFLSIFVFIGTLQSWTPFSPVMKFGETVKESWEGDFASPPVLHMEIYTLEKLALELDSIPPSELVVTLNEKNIKVSGIDQTLKEIAEENKITPSAVYEILSSKYKGQSVSPTSEVPEGIGKFTVESSAKRTGKDVESLIQLLKTIGIEANAETTLKAIAEQLGVTPRDVFKMLADKSDQKAK